MRKESKSKVNGLFRKNKANTMFPVEQDQHHFFKNITNKYRTKKPPQP